MFIDISSRWKIVLLNLQTLEVTYLKDTELCIIKNN